MCDTDRGEGAFHTAPDPGRSPHRASCAPAAAPPGSAPDRSRPRWAPQALAPTREQLDWARKIVSATRGNGAFQLDGQMVDAPVIERARRLLALHD